MFRHTPLRLGTLAALFAGLLIAALTAGYFGLEIVTEIAILAILVLALDIVAGFGGMVSLCHGALMGLGLTPMPSSRRRPGCRQPWRWSRPSRWRASWLG